MKPLPWESNEAPLHTDCQGNRFWIDEQSCEYAQRRGANDLRVFYVEQPHGKLTRLIAHKGRPIFESQSLEAIAARLDIMTRFPEEFGLLVDKNTQERKE